MLSIIIVSYNTCDLILDCINSIYSGTKKTSFEIIVVDNNSIDKTVESIKNDFPGIKIIENKQNLGFATALNQGIKVAKSEIVLSLNSDTIIIGNSIDKAYDYFSMNRNVHLLGVKLFNLDGSIQPAVRNLPSISNCLYSAYFLDKLFPKSKIFGRYYMTYFNYDKMIEVEFVHGAFMMIKKEVFERIGYFDENYFLYTEETDFFYRMKKAGLKIVFYPESTIYHLEGSSSGSNSPQVYQMIHRTQLYFFKKHFKGPELIILQLIQHLAMINRVIFYFLGGLIMFKLALIRKSYYFLKAIL